MTVATELQNLNDNLLDAYDAVSAKSGTVPTNKNTDNLADAITSIPAGGGGEYDPTDPQSVYEATRPSDWLKMPEVGEDEDNVFYFLLMVDKNKTGEIPIKFESQGGGTKTLAFGVTDEQGNFTVQKQLVSWSLSTALTMADFSNETTQGLRQVICRVTGTADFTSIGFTTSAEGSRTRHIMYEFKGKGTQLTSMSVAGPGGGGYYFPMEATNIHYFNLVGTNKITNFSYFFRNAHSLVAVLSLDVSSGSDASYMFEGCSSLIFVCPLNFLNATKLSYLFQGCYALTLAPEITVATSVTCPSMFTSCYSLLEPPKINGSGNITSMDRMFTSCYGLEKTDFSGYNFSGITSASGMQDFLYDSAFMSTIVFGDTFGPNGIIATQAIFNWINGGQMFSSTYPIRIKIDKTDAVLPIAANATTIFKSSNNILIYVPDALYSAYQADTYWATLGTRLKRFSDLPTGA